MDHLALYWPRTGNPLLMYEGEKETKGFDDDREGCSHPPVMGCMLVGTHMIASGDVMVDVLHKALSDVIGALEVADLAHVGPMEGPLAFASRAAAAIYRLDDGWIVTRSWIERSPETRGHSALRGSFHTFPRAHKSNAQDAFVKAPEHWPELLAR